MIHQAIITDQLFTIHKSLFTRKRSWPVSRILYLCGDLSMRPTRRVGGPRHPLPIWPCFQRGLPGRRVTATAGELLPHHFTLASANRGGLFLWHFPSGRPAPACFLAGRCALRSPDFPPRRTEAATRPTP